MEVCAMNCGLHAPSAEFDRQTAGKVWRNDITGLRALA